MELEKQYETEKKNNQIAILEKENQHQEDQILVQHTQRNQLILAILLVSGILGIFVYFFYYYKKVNNLLQIQSKNILEQKNRISEQNVGVEKDKLESLFENGYEKITRGTAGEKSTGLGLSVCKEFVDAMNGKIWVESETGLGSQFTFELLLYDPEIHQSKQKQTQKTNLSTLLSN